jgi:hypothetical protein
MLDFLIQRLYIKNPIIGFNFQLILGFNPTPQPIMYQDTSFSVFSSADQLVASVIIALPLESMVFNMWSTAFRAVSSRREPQSFVPAENKEGTPPVVLIMSTPFFLETPFSILLMLILAYQHAGHDSSARSSRTLPLLVLALILQSFSRYLHSWVHHSCLLGSLGSQYFSLILANLHHVCKKMVPFYLHRLCRIIKLDSPLFDSQLDLLMEGFALIGVVGHYIVPFVVFAVL